MTRGPRSSKIHRLAASPGFLVLVPIVLGEGRFHFVDVAEPAGVVAENVFGGVLAKKYILESTGTGVAWFDYDEDGDLDLFVVNGSRLGGAEEPEASNQLYRNDGYGRFRDVTVHAGLTSHGWGQGVAISDFDNDGDLDLFLTRFGINLGYRNRGDGTFTEIANETGLADAGWGTAAAFADYDRDGVNDLFVGRYVEFDELATPGPGEGAHCFFMSVPVFCGPRGLTPARSSLYRGRGDGTFEDRSAASGVGQEPHFSLGAVWGDLDNDGDSDLYVANDMTPNNFYRNDGEGHFRDVALETGVAYDESGKVQAGMGVDLGDYDNDGWLDIHVTNFSHDHNTLYRNERGLFRDTSFMSGVGQVSIPYLGWGTGFRDFDGDGQLDLFVANGHVYPEVLTADTGTGYAQRNLLFRNLGQGRFEEQGETAGPGMLPARVGRGAAFGDYDDDGDVDIVVANMNARLALLRNDTASRHRWIGFRLIGRESARDAIGARVSLWTRGRLQFQEVRSGGSYLSQSDLRLLFGLGGEASIDRVEIRWPRGAVETRTDVPVDRYLTFVEQRPAPRVPPVKD